MTSSNYSSYKSSKKKSKQKNKHHHQQKYETPKHIKNKIRQEEYKAMNQESRANIIADYLEKVPLLARLQKIDRYNLAKAFKQKTFKPNEPVINQGEPGRQFFIITKGDAVVIIRSPVDNSNTNIKCNNNHFQRRQQFLSEEVAVLHPGDYFGETALLTEKPRNATIKAITKLYCLVLDKYTFVSVFGAERLKVNFGKRGAISASVGNSILPPRRPSTHENIIKTEEIKELIASAVENNVLFAALDEDQVQRIVDVMWSLSVTPGEDIITQGEAGDNFYVVESGIFDIYVERDTIAKHVATRSAGESFGELALMYNSVRSATVRARTDCKLWAVERYMFRKILIRVCEEKLKEYERFLKHVPLLDSLLTNERRAVAEALDEVIYKEGDVIVEQGEDGDTFYIIKKGEAMVYKSIANGSQIKEVARLTSGAFFGERALVKNEKRAATVQVISGQMICLCLERDAFRLLLGPLAELMHRKIDEDYDNILKTKLHLTNSSNSSNIETPDPSNYTSSMAGTKNSYIFYKDDNKTVGGGDSAHEPNDTEYKAYNLEKHAAIASKLHTSKVNQHLTEFKKSDLKVVGILGKGSFGIVELVKHIHTCNTYALKSVSKAQIVSTGQQEHIISEKNVMLMLDSPFVVKLFQTFKDEKHLYFLLEVVLGGELFTVLRARTVFAESTARFYAASVIFAFDYMHSKSIVYRDLKPENLLLDSRGYLKITDFGFAKIIIDRTFTLCGTPDYLAPEVISGGGHGKGVDWWTLGVLLFEMLASYPPFYHEDPMKTYAKIMFGKVGYPKHFSAEAVDVIRGFLAAKPTKRLGIVKGGIKRIQEYGWFKKHNFNWKDLFVGVLRAPIVPNISSTEDVSNFEKFENEEVEELKYVDDHPEWCENF